MAALILTGTPQLVDSFYRPIARVLQLGFSAVAGVVLVWWGLWWWVPVPLILSAAAYSLFFWSRGDRAQTLEIVDGVLTLQDPLTRSALTIPLAEVTVATLYYRQHAVDVVELSVVLGDSHNVRFAVRVLQQVPFEPHTHDIPAEVHDILFGGIAGVFRALAPPSQRPRQTFHDPEGRLVNALRAEVADAAWRRTGIRLWQGMEPSLDLFGYYEGPHSDWLVLDGHAWTRGDRQGEIGGWAFGASMRTAVLFWGMADKQSVEQLPLALVNLGASTTIAIPAPLGEGIAEQEALTADLLHTHAPEGAALLWHLFVHTPRDRWPPVLAQMIADRRAIRPDLDTALPG